MFLEFFRFELKSWFKNPMVYIFFAINFLMIFMAVTNDSVTVGNDMGNVNINSPYAIMTYAAMLSLISIVMTTAFVNRSALKDFNYNFHSLLFSSPIKKSGYLIGRYLSSALVASIPLLGVLLAIVVAPYFVSEEIFKVGPFYLGAYINSFLLFILPNTILISAIIFGLATSFRNTTITFVGAIGILIGYLMAGNFLHDLDNEVWGVLLDPLGINSLSLLTKYWTLDEKNTMWLTLSGPILLNRIIWLGVALLIFAISYFRFDFAAKRSKKTLQIQEEKINTAVSNQEGNDLPQVTIHKGFWSNMRQLRAQSASEFWGVVKSPAFIVIALFAMVNMSTALSMTDSWGGSGNYPVTYRVLSSIDGSFYLFVSVIIMYYSGAMIWRERTAKMNEIVDASPFPSWLPMLAKSTALIGIVGILLLVAMICGMGTQAIKGYYIFEPLLYIKQIFLIDYTYFIILIAAAFFIQIVINNLYIGYFGVIVFLVLNNFLWPGIDVNSNLLIFGGAPEFRYSDLTQFVPYAKGVLAYKFYWILGSILFAITGILFWVRGKGLGFSDRVRIAKQRFNPQFAMLSTVLLVFWLGTASFLYYSADVVNTNLGNNESELNTVSYEKKYKRYDGIPQPRIIALDHKVDIFPEVRALLSTTLVTIKNKHAFPIDSIHFTFPQVFDVAIELENATLVHEDKALRYYIYEFNSPMIAGDSMEFLVHSNYKSEGIENEISMERINQNGTFVQNSMMMPRIGYSAQEELGEASKRKEHDLNKKERMSKLGHSCSSACSNTYISTDSDWIRLSCTISTSSDQIAIAPGTLTKEWTEDNRKFFRYELDQPVLNFYSFLSARYEVKREKWDDVDLEVYYHEGHAYNIDKMMLAMRNSLKYFDQNFLPYPHQQARIIEFPRFDDFAQAFPGTMPYSESMGYLADLKDENDIDRVYYTVAHEMAHQWWAHQVIGANVQGSTMLSETFAQYSALMIMEKQYGKERIQQFLKYEMDAYLRNRGSENIEELPLMLVEDQQYIHYRKGSVVMYALREYLGEDVLNNALHNFANRTAYQEPPYTTTNIFMQELEAVMPDSLNYLVEDLFRKIVLYNNKATASTYTQLPDGKYEVKIDVEIEKYSASGSGTETSIAFDDYIYIGVYNAPESSSNFGKLLYYQKHKFNKSNNQVKVIVDEEPYEAGIDPIHLLIDRIPEDNITAVTFGAIN